MTKNHEKTIRLTYQVWPKTLSTQCRYRVLCGLSLLLTTRSGLHNERHVHVHEVLTLGAELKLTKGLDERTTLDIADSAAELKYNVSYETIDRKAVSPQ